MNDHDSGIAEQIEIPVSVSHLFMLLFILLITKIIFYINY